MYRTFIEITKRYVYILLNGGDATANVRSCEDEGPTIAPSPLQLRSFAVVFYDCGALYRLKIILAF